MSVHELSVNIKPLTDRVLLGVKRVWKGGKEPYFETEVHEISQEQAERLYYDLHAVVMNLRGHSTKRFKRLRRWLISKLA